jgi:uncharacterized iron-regulated membrane protein
MTPRAIRIWSWLHRWTSLICTLFALMLCITGLPLIFKDELGPDLKLEATTTAPGTASIDDIIARAKAARPGQVVPYLFYDRDHPIVKVPTSPLMTTDPGDFHYQVFDTRTGRQIEVPQPNEGFLYIMLRLHLDLFAGIGGTLFLGFMGLLLCIAIVSGVVLYGPFTRRLDFGAIRRGKPQRTWLDLHNLLGIGTLAWFAVVSFTGVINTLAAPIELAWQANQLVEMAAQAKPAEVRTAVPGMNVMTVAFPGTPFATPSHVAIFLTGNTPITSRILKPALADATTGQIVSVRDMPWYATALFMSQPLHFGDYGGLPLKIIWALLDVVTIVVLISGLYLWWAKRRRRRSTGTTIAGLQAAAR